MARNCPAAPRERLPAMAENGAVSGFLDLPSPRPRATGKASPALTADRPPNSTLFFLPDVVFQSVPSEPCDP